MAVCRSEVVAGVEVDDCVGNPNADIVYAVPRIYGRFDLFLGIGF